SPSHSSLLPPPCPPLFPYTTLFRSVRADDADSAPPGRGHQRVLEAGPLLAGLGEATAEHDGCGDAAGGGVGDDGGDGVGRNGDEDRKSTRLNSSHVSISYAVFCLKK